MSNMKNLFRAELSNELVEKGRSKIVSLLYGKYF